jgi:hypothetical protein
MTEILVAHATKMGAPGETAVGFIAKKMATGPMAGDFRN